MESEGSGRFPSEQAFHLHRNLANLKTFSAICWHSLWNHLLHPVHSAILSLEGLYDIWNSQYTLTLTSLFWSSWLLLSNGNMLKCLHYNTCQRWYCGTRRGDTHITEPWQGYMYPLICSSLAKGGIIDDRFNMTSCVSCYFRGVKVRKQTTCKDEILWRSQRRYTYHWTSVEIYVPPMNEIFSVIVISYELQSRLRKRGASSSSSSSNLFIDISRLSIARFNVNARLCIHITEHNAAYEDYVLNSGDSFASILSPILALLSLVLLIILNHL